MRTEGKSRAKVTENKRQLDDPYVGQGVFGIHLTDLEITSCSVLTCTGSIFLRLFYALKYTIAFFLFYFFSFFFFFFCFLAAGKYVCEADGFTMQDVFDKQRSNQIYCSNKRSHP